MDRTVKLPHIVYLPDGRFPVVIGQTVVTCFSDLSSYVEVVGAQQSAAGSRPSETEPTERRETERAPA